VTTTKRISTALSAVVALTLPALADGAPAPAGPMSGGLLGIAPWILIFVVFYFLLIRPQQKQASEHKKMLEGLKKGDRILTQGGLYGTVSAVKGKVLEVKLTEEVKVLVSKSAVSSLVTGDPGQEPAPAAPAAS
jgi:preprotein translocase subunit YajC